MTDRNWSRIKEIVDEAIHRKPEDRPQFLNDACGGNDSIRREVESLLSSFDSARDFLQAPAFEAGANETKTVLTGRVLGHYEILRPLGEGGMGTVYLGRDTKLDRRVAVKVLNTRYERNGDNIRRFMREAKAASALNHPNILTIFEIGEFEGSHFIVSEYIDGRTLREILTNETLELRMIVDIAAQIAGALAVAHNARIVHRDIKPENIIIRDGGYVKVLDFGLAKLLSGDSKGDDKTLLQNTTAAGIIMGTVNYMSPEQAKGNTVDERTDIFSLGVVLYEMLTGKQPFTGDSSLATLRNVIDHEPEPIRSCVAGVPDELERITSRMLEKAPEDRYRSMSDAADDLRSLNSGSLSAVRPTASENQTAVLQATTAVNANTTAENTGSSSRWYRRWQAIAALLLLLLVSVGVAGYFLLQRASTTTEIRSVAVMPFVNETGDPQVEYLSDGMTETLISSLSELPNIKVKARTSVFRYKGKEFDPRTVGKELGVEAIVNGRVTQRDRRTNVSLEVVNADTQDVIFSVRYDKPQSELVTLQRDIARDVSGKLKSKLSGADEAKVAKSHTADPEALQLYLQGQFYRYKGGRKNVLLATDYFNKAIAKDSNYALAYAGLALNYGSYYLYNLVPDRQKRSAAAKRAIELDDSLAEAHLAAGDSRRAVQLNPDYADAHVGLCIDLTMQKNFDEGIKECSVAHQLDPSSSVVSMHLGAAYFFARRPDEAIEVLTRAHDLDPTLWVPLGYLGAAQTLKGQYTEAANTFRKAIEISDGSPNPKSHLAYALAKAGQRAEALRVIDDLKRLAEREHINTFHFAVPYIGLGDKNEAFFWLGRGVDEGSIDFAELDVHPWYDDLRSDPRFQALLTRTNGSK